MNDPYDLALLYEEQHADFTEDLAFHKDLAKRFGGPVLELGVGAGRVGLTLAAAGYELVGIDTSPAMIDLANRRANERGLSKLFRAVQGDALVCDSLVEPGWQAGLIIVPFNSLCHILTTADLTVLLRAVWTCLRPGGALVPSLFVPRPEWLYRSPGSLYPVSQFWSDSRQETVTILEQTRYDPISQINHLQWFFDLPSEADVWERRFDLRIWYPQELLGLLRAGGFTVDEIWGDYGPFAVGPDSLVCSPVAVKPA